MSTNSTIPEQPRAMQFINHQPQQNIRFQILSNTEPLSTENLYRLELIYIQRLGCECQNCSERIRYLLDEIDKLQSKPIHANIVNNFTKQHTNEPCCICMTGDSQKQSYTLPCNHIMHVDCLDTWFLHNHTCPVCRTDFNILKQ